MNYLIRSLSIVCMYFICSCSNNEIVEGNYWSYSDEYGYREWTFTNDYIQYFDGVFSSPLFLHYYKDSIRIGHDLLNKKHSSSFRIININKGDTIFFVNNFETIKLCRMTSLDFYIGKETTDEQEDKLRRIYQLRELYYCPPPRDTTIELITMDESPV